MQASDGNAPKAESIGGSNLKNENSIGFQTKQKSSLELGSSTTTTTSTGVLGRNQHEQQRSSEFPPLRDNENFTSPRDRDMNASHSVCFLVFRIFCRKAPTDNMIFEKLGL